VHLVGDQQPTEKWIFREAVQPYVTHEVYRRRKQAFAAPFRWKKGGPLYLKLQSLISRENAERLGFADWTWCEGIVDRCYANGDELLFRKALWLAQIISLGLQFKIQTWRSNKLRV
jgi:asparagine synthase (glutamine-hydrolysing)